MRNNDVLSHDCGDLPERGLFSDELPLRPGITLRQTLPEPLLRLAGAQMVASAMSCLLANAMWGHWLGANWIHYSRDNSHYANVRPVVPSWYTRRAMVAGVEILVAQGLLDDWRTAPSPHATVRSRVRATGALIAGGIAQGIRDLDWRRPPEVVIRDGDGRRILNLEEAVPAHRRGVLQAIAADVLAHNQFLDTARIGLNGTQNHPAGLLASDGFSINPIQRHYYRVFNRDLDHGGRWYGPWWQGVPANLRHRLTINGLPTIELDYSACQLRLMFAQQGLPDPLQGHIRQSDPRFDLYSVDGVSRDWVKLAVLIGVNAPNLPKACGALANELATAGLERDQATEQARDLLRRVRSAFRGIEALWFTGIGLRMQRIDADICAQVQAEMRACGDPVLSIHDAFIASVEVEDRLRAVMERAFRTAYEALRG